MPRHYLSQEARYLLGGFDGKAARTLGNAMYYTGIAYDTAAVRTALRELEQHGYIVRARTGGEDARWLLAPDASTARSYAEGLMDRARAAVGARRNPPAGFKPTKGEYWDERAKGGKSTLTVTETRRTVYPTQEKNPRRRRRRRSRNPYHQPVAGGARYVVLGSDHVLSALQALPGVSVDHEANWSDDEDTFTCRKGDRWCIVIHRLYGMSAAEAFDDADVDYTDHIEWGDDMDARTVAAFVKRALR